MARRREPDPGPTLFEAASTRRTASTMPLAERVRPQTLDQVLGHRDLLADGRPLARAIASGRPPSMILWGPPGSGKTTLANVIAAATDATFVSFSAVLGGVAEVRKIVAAARERLAFGRGATVLFVDEIHRFNKAQQDAFLPHVEDGTVTLIGATTENPSFSLNAPLLSRCTVFRLEGLGEEDLVDVLRRALEHVGGVDIQVEEAALAAIAAMAQGDARRALGILEFAMAQALRAEASCIDAGFVHELGGHKTLLYDKTGDQHYNVVSALIKSMRGSDPDAAVYWLMRMIDAGDDPRFVSRRLIVFASEDVGNADPRALQLTMAADQAFQRLGLPEGIYPLAQAAIYLACAPKSNACTVAWHRARKRIEETGALDVPPALRSASTALAKSLGHGADYRYPHNEVNGYAPGVQYLPDRLAGERYYEPSERGLEGRIRAWLERLRESDDRDTPSTDTPSG